MFLEISRGRISPGLGGGLQISLLGQLSDGCTVTADLFLLSAIGPCCTKTGRRASKIGFIFYKSDNAYLSIFLEISGRRKIIEAGLG